MDHHTRIKICGLTRQEDVRAAITAGADALGFVFYPKSPRYVVPETAARLIAEVPPFITTVGLFVNASSGEAAKVAKQTGISLLQFHGDETFEECQAEAEAAHRSFVRVVRMQPDIQGSDLLKYDEAYRAASGLFAGLLLDAFVDSYGGSGKVFDWSLIPKELAPRVVLSGGLSAQNATEAVTRIRPYAVDVSSGVELQKGVKDHEKIRAFIRAVREADASLNAEERDHHERIERA